MLATQFDVARESQTGAQSTERTQEWVQRRTAKGTKSTWDRISLFACVVVCTGAGWVMAATSAHIAAVNQQVDQLRTSIQQTSAVNGSLSATLDTLTQPSHILAWAQQQGMKPSPTIDIPVVRSHGTN